MNKEFEDYIDQIDALLNQSRSKWQLSLQWMDYDDVCQLIRIHIHTKWHLWKQDLPFAPWCRRVINNRMINLIRDNYGTFCRPCLKCKHNLGNDACGITQSKTQDDSCDLYAKWSKKRAHVYNLKMPVSLEESKYHTISQLHDEIDFDLSTNRLHEAVLNKLSNVKHQAVYIALYIDHLDDDTIAEQMNFTPDIQKNGKRYKQLNNLKNKFLKLAKEAMDEEDIL